MSAHHVRATLRDSALIALAGVGLGLLANALSPRGISLGRDYFAAAAPLPSAAVAARSATHEMSAARRARLAERGIRVIGHPRALELLNDPLVAAGRILFIDARDDAHYEAGHLPRAHQLDHYRLDKHIAEILGACALAEHIVVYCNGGECEDSELVANDLLQFGVPATKLLVYAGGVAEWREKQLPLELGTRGSGRMTQP